jgi:hypothetical protein
MRHREEKQMLTSHIRRLAALIGVAALVAAGPTSVAIAGHHHCHRHHHCHHHSGIPQHNGGDRDTDNNGGPSDGDGNL